MAGGVGVTLVETDVLPGKIRLDRALGRCGTVPAPPRIEGIVQRHTFRSRHRGTDVNAVVVLPNGVTSPRGLPVTVALHGNGGNGPSVVNGLHLDRYLADAVATRKVPPFALVAVDGGANSYWHPRADGDDPVAMITEELLPWLGRQGARTDRFAAIGWSMGGYGALQLAQSVEPRRMAAVVAASPALFPSYDDARRTNRMAFDDRADFTHHNVFARLDRLRSIPTWVDCGTSDPFAPMARRLRDRLHPAGGAMRGGCHDGAFWCSRLPAQLSFIGRHLTGG
jgi:enterochelin esterase-like enzyme